MSTKKRKDKQESVIDSPVKWLRQEKMGLRQAEFARLMGLFPSEVDRLEKSEQGLRYLKLLLRSCREAKIGFPELIAYVDALPMPVISKKPRKSEK